jgi:DNA polymerase III psi subunit
MKKAYLQTMGIITWRLRVCSYNLINSERQVIGTLLAKSNSLAELELLGAILQALPIASSPGPWNGSSPVLFLGEPFSKYSPSTWISTHSLNAMLENPKLKADVWKKLKNFIHQLN